MGVSLQRLLAMGLGCSLGLTTGIAGAIAAEEVRLSFGPLAMGIPVADLAVLAATGEAPEDLDRLLAVSDQDPATWQRILNHSLEINPLLLDVALNSGPGESVLDRLGEAIHPPSKQASRQALRAALMAAAHDGEMTLLEIVQAYPNPQVVVNGDRLAEGYGQLMEALEPFLD